MTTGQINFENDLLGKAIVNIVSQNFVNNIVEIGAWNGLGSTRCVLEGLKRKDNYKFISFECDSVMYAKAVVNNQQKLSDNFSLHLGKIVDEEEMLSWFDLSSLDSENSKYLSADIDNMSKVPNLKHIIPEEIDLLILDGGEFSTYPEWKFLKNRSDIVILDDTSTFKCKLIREEVLKSQDLYQILIDKPNHRNGFLIYKKL